MRECCICADQRKHGVPARAICRELRKPVCAYHASMCIQDGHGNDPLDCSGMQIPTSEEIRAAHAAIDREGPVADTTAGLSLLAIRDPTLKAIVERWRSAIPANENALAIHGLLVGALISGLNLGVRIGEARAGK